MPCFSQATLFGGNSDPSNNHTIWERGQYNRKKLLSPVPYLLRTTNSGTLCPPCRTLAFTRATAISSLGSQRKNNTIRHPSILIFLKRRTYPRPDRVVSNPKVCFAAVNSLNLVRSRRPARTFWVSGANGDNPAAIRSLHSGIRGSLQNPLKIQWQRWIFLPRLIQQSHKLSDLPLDCLLTLLCL